MTRDTEHWLLRVGPHETYEAYRQATGPSAVEIARSMSADALLDEIARAGLRGRGGAGFPTATKWRSVVEHACPTRYAVCNAAEGEPGTFKDRFLLRRDPYSMLEGLLVAAHVSRAKEAYVACKASFVRELARIRGAIGEMAAAGALGGVKINVVEGPDEYLFGEEKALLEVCEGNDPLPREPHYPPYERGLFATQASPNPAIVNNVETLARVPGILRAGAASFRAIGTADTPGPIIFTVSGDVARPGVYEAPAGIELTHLFHALAGGPRPGRFFKAALSGVSTLAIPAGKFGVKADHASMHLIGSGLGSAGFILFDDLASMPRVTQAVARFLYVESCNQCPACKNGLRTASSAIDELFDEKLATPDDFERAYYGAHRAPQGNRCYLPVQGSKLIPDLMKRFEAEFDAQLKDPTGGREPYAIPKLVDFDEARGAFVCDEQQSRKNPNWTYAPAPITPPATPPPQTPEPRGPQPRKVARPASPSSEPGLQTISVRLMADVRAALAGVLRDRHDEVELDRVVNDALREWVRQRAGRGDS